MQIKLAVERVFRSRAPGKFRLTVLRPTAVFGPGGRNLVKLVQAVESASEWSNYIRSCLYGDRRMHLVSIGTVLDALMFLLNRSGQQGDDETFIVSEDAEPMNNFRDIEHLVMTEFGRPAYRLPRVELPGIVLQSLLHLMGRSDTQPRRIYRADKLFGLGFEKSAPLPESLHAYLSWYRQRYQAQR